MEFQVPFMLQVAGEITISADSREDALAQINAMDANELVNRSKSPAVTPTLRCVKAEIDASQFKDLIEVEQDAKQTKADPQGCEQKEDAACGHSDNSGPADPSED